MQRGALEVIEFEPRHFTEGADLAIHAPESEGFWARLRLSRTLTSCLAAVASLALHALLVAPALCGSGTPRERLPDNKDAGDTALQWIVLDDSLAPSAPTPASLGAPVLVAISLSDILPPPPAATPVVDTPKTKRGSLSLRTIRVSA